MQPRMRTGGVRVSLGGNGRRSMNISAPGGSTNSSSSLPLVAGATTRDGFSLVGFDVTTAVEGACVSMVLLKSIISSASHPTDALPTNINTASAPAAHHIAHTCKL